MRIIEEEQLGFEDVLIQPKRSTINSRSEVSLMRTFTWGENNKNAMTCIPIIAANMGTVGTPKMAKLLSRAGYMCALEKHYSAKDICDLFFDLENIATCEGQAKHAYTDRVALSIGVNEPLDVIREVADEHKVNIVNVDIANGYIPKLADRVKEIRSAFPDMFIIAGTVVTSDITQDLIMAGANCVRVSIGGGSMCTTRIKTGVGRPILSTIIDCADAAHHNNAYVMSDGGCTCPGDICKALGAGADFIMTGSMFAGCDEADGEVIIKNDKKWKKYYGMSSDYAQEKHFGGAKQYRTSEGRTKLIPYTGKLDDVLRDISGGVKSMMCYIGARKLKHIPRQCTFYKVRKQYNNKFENCEDFSS